MSQPFTHFAAALNFIMAGNSRFTIRSLATDKRYTYRVKSNDDGSCYFVSVLYGSNNTEDYRYIGVIRRNGFAQTTKSTLSKEDPRVKAFAWALANLRANKLREDKMEIWHEGTCGKCGRTLTVPESVASGFGPECAKRFACLAA